MKKKSNLFLLISITAFFGCTENNTSKKEVKPSQKIIQQSEIKENKQLTKLANFFGGISTSATDSMIPSEIKSQWDVFNKDMNSTYLRIDEKKKIMNSWKNKNITISNGTLFYPFSGPDFLHANIFFPEFDTIIMIGLEPTGNSTIDISNYTTPDAFNKISRSLTTILNQSFFRTKSMAVDFKTENLNGTIPIFLHFIARHQFAIQSIKDIQLNAKGELITVSKQNKNSPYFIFSQ